MPTISAKEIEAFARTGQPGKLYDTEGLFIELRDTGKLYWRYRYKFAGKDQQLTLGRYPKVGLKAAREERDRLQAMLRQGINPAVQRKATKLAQVQTAHEIENSFERVAREWHGTRVPTWGRDTAERVLRRLEVWAFPYIGKMPVSRITVDEITLVIERVTKTDRPGRATGSDTARRLKADIENVFRYAVARRLVDHNPVFNLAREIIPKAKVKHHAAITDPAVFAELLRRIDKYPGAYTTVMALKLLALTFVRPGELRNARWSEFDLDGARWRIPAERMKMGRDHIVPLSPQAVALLKQVREDLEPDGDDALVVPSMLDRTRPLSENTLNKALKDLAVAEHTSHGFRSTASTLLNELGLWHHDVIERALAHAPGDKVRAAYHRSEYLAQRVELMRVWAELCDHLRGGGTWTEFQASSDNVVTIKRRKS